MEHISKYCDLLQTYPISPSRQLTYGEVLAYVNSIHDLFYDENRYFHHYKWYVGPRQDLDVPAFVSHEEFKRRFALKL